MTYFSRVTLINIFQPYPRDDLLRESLLDLFIDFMGSCKRKKERKKETRLNFIYG